MLSGLIKRVGIDMFKPIGKVSRKKYIYFQSGAGYSTPNGIRFSRDNPIHKVPEDEYDHLIKNPSFREPTDQEILLHFK